MDAADRVLLRALIEGSLREEDRLRVDNLLARSEEARRQLSEWRGWKELDISLVADHKHRTNGSALLQVAIENMQSEVIGIGHELANRAPLTVDFSADSNIDSGVVDTAWINRITGITVGEEIGRGAMGMVYEGFDQTLGRRVAIKIPSRHCVRNPESRERFTREAQAAAQLCHENIVAIHSIQHVEGVPILVLQFIDGETLAARVERTGPLSADELLEMGLQIARGLATAHAAGIVHRDLKPENLMIENRTNVVRIADFGLAKRESASQLTQPNVVAGTPAYMSPEQTLGQPLDSRSDLFSFGSVIRFAATGQPPFGRDDTDLVLHRIRSQNLEPLRQIRPDLPIAVCNAFERLLVKDVSSRTKSASEFLKQLSEQRAKTPVWSAKTLAMLVSGTFVLGLLLLWGFLTADRTNRSRSPSATAKQAALSDKTILEFPFAIPEVERRFRTLVDAISSAEDGQEIMVDGDGPYESPRIDIGRKRLSIVANKGASPLFVNKTGTGVSNQQFLTSQSDLHLRGIRVEWPVEIELTDFQMMAELPAIFCNDGTLKLDDCAIRRGSSGVCAYGSRSIEIRGCTFEGGSHCLGWIGQGYSVVIENSTLRAKNGCLILFPLSNSQAKGTNQFKMVNVTIVGEVAIEFGLTRVQTNSVRIQSEDCVFDNSNLISLFGGANVARQVVMPAPMLSLMRSALVWNETNCRHLSGQTYLSGRNMKQPDRRNPSSLVGISAWRKQWQSDFPGSNEFNAESIQKPMNSP